ncbi:ROK family transcriptional regulator OS=Streptomyces microflavus OX=1919 GN=HUT09_31665 PE=3 SV=1 [Streptomyces microflavus]
MAERNRRTVRDLRRGNRARVLQRLYFDGPLSRQELGPATGLSSGSISNVVAELSAEGLLQEAGIVDSDGGRPRTLLRVAPDGGLLVGIDIGETRVRVELFDLSLTELARTERLLAQHGYDVDRIVAHVRTGVADVLRDAGADPHRLLGIGIGVPGIIEREGPEGPDGKRTAVVHGQTIGWHAVPFEQLLREAVDVPPEVPLFIDNGAKTLGRAEMWFGGGRGRAPPPSPSSARAWAPVSTTATSSPRTARASPSNGATPPSSCAAAGAAAAPSAAWRRTRARRPCASAGARRAARSPRTPTTRPPSPHSSPPPTRRPAGRPRTGSRSRSSTRPPNASARPSRTWSTSSCPLASCSAAGRACCSAPTCSPRSRRYANEYALRHAAARTTIEMGRLGPDAVTVGAATLPLADFLTRGGSRPAPGPRPEGTGAPSRTATEAVRNRHRTRASSRAGADGLPAPAHRRPAPAHRRPAPTQTPAPPAPVRR